MDVVTPLGKAIIWGPPCVTKARTAWGDIVVGPRWRGVAVNKRGMVARTRGEDDAKVSPCLRLAAPAAEKS